MQGRLRKKCGVSFDDGRFCAAEWRAPRPLIHPRNANIVEIDNAGPARPQADLPVFVGRMLPLIFAGREKLAVIAERLQHRPPDREPQIVPLASLCLDRAVLERLGLAVDYLIETDQVLLWAEPDHIVVPIV